MAGYLFSLDSRNSLNDCILKGVYSTKISEPKKVWRGHHEGTFADYCSMKKGDNVYFFIKRKIYGIGSLVNIYDDCKYLNYPDSNIPSIQKYKHIKNDLLLDNGNKTSLNNRIICTFKPEPFFFENGIDMDEALSSSPSQFKILRAFWKLSFIKFSDEENQAFKTALFRNNIETLKNPAQETIIQSNYLEFHEQIKNKISLNSKYNLSLSPLLSTISEKSGRIKHEMAIEAALIYQLSNNHKKTIEVFGKWDYLSHQVIASPFKPIDYMDKMDIFGYKYIDNQEPIIEKYLVIEIKKGIIEEQDILQLMKYVDWIKNEYAFGDYRMINAFMLGFDYHKNVISNLQENIERKFIRGVRPSISDEWNNVKLITYKLDDENAYLNFSNIKIIE